MLNIYLEKEKIPKEKEFIHDVEVEFLKKTICGTALERKIMKEIDKAEWLEEDAFIDRFGYKLRMKYLSTGCKAALCVVNSNENQVIDLVECGPNAIGAILSFCSNGNVFIKNYEDGFYSYENKKVTIRFENYIFSTIDRLNLYITEERYYGEPDLSIGDVSHV